MKRLVNLQYVLFLLLLVSCNSTSSREVVLTSQPTEKDVFNSVQRLFTKYEKLFFKVEKNNLFYNLLNHFLEDGRKPWEGKSLARRSIERSDRLKKLAGENDKLLNELECLGLLYDQIKAAQFTINRISPDLPSHKWVESHSWWVELETAKNNFTATERAFFNKYYNIKRKYKLNVEILLQYFNSSSEREKLLKQFSGNDERIEKEINALRSTMNDKNINKSFYKFIKKIDCPVPFVFNMIFETNPNIQRGREEYDNSRYSQYLLYLKRYPFHAKLIQDAYYAYLDFEVAIRSIPSASLPINKLQIVHENLPPHELREKELK